MGLFPHASLVLGLTLALVSAAAFNWSWVAQHAITSKLPRLTIRHPWRSLGLLFGHRAGGLPSSSASPAGRSTSSRSASPRSRSSRPSRRRARAARRARPARGGHPAASPRVDRRRARGSSGSSSSPSRSRVARAAAAAGSWVAVAVWFLVSFVLVGIAIGPARRSRAWRGLRHRRGGHLRGRRRRNEGGGPRRLARPLRRPGLGLPRPRVRPDPALLPARPGARDRRPLVVLTNALPIVAGRPDLPRDDAARCSARSASSPSAASCSAPPRSPGASLDRVPGAAERTRAAARGAPAPVPATRTCVLTEISP